MPRFLLYFVVLSTFSGVIAADDGTFPGIKKLMSDQEYSAAGLDKLTDAEHTALDAWLLQYTAVDAPELQTNNEEVKAAVAEAEVRSTIEGDFNGWTGTSVFRLANGQIWRQRRAGKYYYNGDDREVVIRKNFMGFYVMTHIAGDKTVAVSRVRQ